MQPSGWRRRARAPSRPRVPCAGPIPVPPVRGCVCDFFFSFSRFYPALGPFIRAPMPTGTQPRTCSHLPGSAGVGAHFSEILSTGGEYNFVPVGPVIAGLFLACYRSAGGLTFEPLGLMNRKVVESNAAGPGILPLSLKKLWVELFESYFLVI